ncbi:5-histidylcysteine sulfoxide synthase [Ancylomarina euxinus]|uniref:5-histidylcysteine sulfoxide synthase n=1 Tax=Ancylomarina euxinus TaxID=2283627 RepID=A0A425Y1X0_9BACT|nr:5-histidylcysteine sulfoxide synthase [Ancylomarina euxinus]MCZ4695079.1 5-histidylcysteine sulfoxide synthase [Ancylomarina euxinus]MUP14985.1 5-histidylcysteine sulfoxide synthase [Ancylomarina euxinus]RRG21944.1 5-histidylcysteine sulfoxide synthase [Ancylomarina euxinus]
MKDAIDSKSYQNILVTKTPILNQGNPADKREEILKYFLATWELDDRLYDSLKDNTVFYMRADPLRHPLIFYIGHTATFYINKLMLAGLITKRINPKFESIFAVGVDEMSWDDLNEAHYDWPTVQEVRDYRKQVKAMMEDLIANLPLKIPINWNDPFWVIMMGIEHQRIHIETSSVLIRQLPIDMVQANPLFQICTDAGIAPENELVKVKSGNVSLGKERDAALYGWDNEFGNLSSDVKGFSASKYLVSNKEYMAFVDDKGYKTQKWWTEEGWNWVRYKGCEYPVFWVKDDENWKLRCMLQKINMPWNWPVEVNYLEAKAFCNWKSAQTDKKLRMPGEAEYYLLRNSLDIPDQPYWNKAPGNINLEHYASSCPVDKFEFNGIYDAIGNVWQWTEMPISALEGFEIHPFYDDFSTPTFDARHNLIKGGSWISTGNLAIKDSRYAFRRHFFQHAGFRYIESEEELVIQDNYYESDDLVSQYCEFQYGQTYFGVENYALACLNLIEEHLQSINKGAALDLGCATGRTSFELAKYFDKVTGLDFSTRFIRIGTQLKESGRLNYSRIEEGKLDTFMEVKLSDFGLDVNSYKVEFFQGDACNLKPFFTAYDLVFASNLIDRLYDPLKFLRDIHSRINVGGLLVLTSPYSWLEEFTDVENWIGGYRKNGEPYSTLDGLKEKLQEHFDLIAEPKDVPFVIRETARKYQHTIAQMTIWRRK